MSDWMKDLAAGMAGLFILAVVGFVWIGIPMLWMSYPGDHGQKMLTIPGTVWVLLPAVVLAFGVAASFGRAVRGR